MEGEVRGESPQRRRMVCGGCRERTRKWLVITVLVVYGEDWRAVGDQRSSGGDLGVVVVMVDEEGEGVEAVLLVAPEKTELSLDHVDFVASATSFRIGVESSRDGSSGGIEDSGLFRPWMSRCTV